MKVYLKEWREISNDNDNITNMKNIISILWKYEANDKRSAIIMKKMKK